MAALSPPPLLLPLPPQKLPFTRVSPFQPTHFPPFLSLRRLHHHNRSSYITNAATSSSSGVVATTTTTTASGYATSEEHDAVNIAEDVTQVLFSSLPRAIFLYPVENYSFCLFGCVCFFFLSFECALWKNWNGFFYFRFGRFGFFLFPASKTEMCLGDFFFQFGGKVYGCLIFVFNLMYLLLSVIASNSKPIGNKWRGGPGSCTSFDTSFGGCN